MSNRSVILFIHGGPGMSSSYFNGWFDYLNDSYDLFFYDQDYSFDSTSNPIDILVEELIKNLKRLNESYEAINIYAHSWGVFLFLKAYEKMSVPERKILSTIVLSNPSDSNWDNFCKSGDVLFSRIPEEIMNEISSCSDGIQLMKLALPYYFGDTTTSPCISIDRYDIDAYDIVAKEMEGYDLDPIIKELSSSNVYTILCDKDFETEDGCGELIKHSNVIIFHDAGHFPFAEKPESYQRVIESIFKKHE